MLSLDSHPSGRHFLQIPGPSPVPDRILRALSLPTIDHRGPEFAVLGKTGPGAALGRGAISGFISRWAGRSACWRWRGSRGW